MSIDIIIDKLTDCLVLRETNTVVKTEYKKLDTSIPKKANGMRHRKMDMISMNYLLSATRTFRGEFP